jgi:sulfite exporter TauE/SafE
LAGWLGGFFTGPAGVWMKGSLLCAGAILLLIFSVRDLKKASGVPCPGVSFKPLKGWPFLTGLVLGFYPCAPFAAGLAKATTLANPVTGTLFFLFLFLGTTLVLLPAPLIATGMRTPFFRRLGCFFGLVAGVWFLIEGVASWF